MYGVTIFCRRILLPFLKKLPLRSQGGFSPAFSISIAVRIQGLIDRKIKKIQNLMKLTCRFTTG